MLDDKVKLELQKEKFAITTPRKTYNFKQYEQPVDLWISKIVETMSEFGINVNIKK